MTAEKIALLTALSASLCWAMGGMIAMNITRRVGAIAFNRWRMVGVLCMLAMVCPWVSFGVYPNLRQVLLLCLSGVFGIFLGDTFLFLSLSRLGPRRLSMLFAGHAPLTALLGFFVLSEVLSWMQVGGIALTFSGILVAVFYGKRADKIDQWEEVRGSFVVGAAMGGLAALGHAVGALFARPVMEAGVDPLMATLIRVGVSVVGYFLLLLLPYRELRGREALGIGGVRIVLLSGFVGMLLGASLYVYALGGAAAGIVATLASMSPVLVLPFLWIRNGYPPAPLAWAGAALAAAGAAMIFA